ncbi:MAG TPA: flagellar hook-basal body complex protein FliE [Bryobacteraceae bacterium]|nr:flagellar hook-basal body complex protein FliE [Bryobacteraceae bacterium]
MLAPIAPIAAVVLPAAIPPLSGAGAAAATGGFQNVLQAAMEHVAKSSATADSAVQNYLSGADTELHSTILATQSAELDFELFLQIRNKVVAAYEEIMKMPI